MTTRFPWGTGPAPAHHCHGCKRVMGKTTGHYIFPGALLLCSRCAFPDKGSGHVHAAYYPDCPDKWHDMYDHLQSVASRAAAWYVIQPRNKETA